MKREGNLMSKIACFENLQLAYYKAKKGKETKPEVWEYGKDLTANLRLLQHQLNTGSVAVGNYHYFNIYDPKTRRICAAPKRVLHHAMMNICHPVFENYQIADSYATRLQKGTHKAIDKACRFQARYAYFLKMDVRKYFDSIDHQVLLTLLSKAFKDSKLLDLFSKIVFTYQTISGKGLPIGNLTSQYFANHYLAVADHYIKEVLQIKAYIRYMDDFVIWHYHPQELQSIGQSIIEHLEKVLHLQLKTFSLNTCLHGLSFLGYRLFPNKMLLTNRSKMRYIEKIKRSCYFQPVSTTGTSLLAGFANSTGLIKQVSTEI